MHCQSCGAEIAAADVNIQTSWAKCAACGAVFNFTQPAAGNFERPRRLVAQPRNVMIEDDGLQLRIVRRWFTPAAIFMAFFCVFWDGFLCFWYSAALTPAWAPNDFKLAFTLFPLIHVAVGVGLTYFTFACFVNKTTILVDGHTLSINHGPLPWPGNRVIPSRDIRQLYVESTTHRSENSTTTSHHLSAITTSGEKLRLLSNVGGADEAGFFEQTIEERLGIPDEPVAGEA